MFSNKLSMAPIKENVGNVLDVGTGTGLWAIDFGTAFFNTHFMQLFPADQVCSPGDEHPSAQVLGVDLSPIQPGKCVDSTTLNVQSVALIANPTQP